MIVYNLIVIFDESLEKILLCKRKKDPYKGLYNFIGGKKELGESSIDAAYREMEEESNLTREDVKLVHLMDFDYIVDHCKVEVYVGIRVSNKIVFGDENELFWSSLDHDFFDSNIYAGEGNMGHILWHVKMSKDILFSKK